MPDDILSLVLSRIVIHTTCGILTHFDCSGFMFMIYPGFFIIAILSKLIVALFNLTPVSSHINMARCYLTPLNCSTDYRLQICCDAICRLLAFSPWIWILRQLILTFLEIQNLRIILMRFAHDLDTENRWGVGQIGAILAWLPLVTQLMIHILSGLKCKLISVMDIR